MQKYKVNLSKKGNQINSIDDWYNYAPPMDKDKHWKDGRSAKELANYIIGGEGYLPQELEDILEKDIKCPQDIILEGEPEAITGLKSRGRGRTHDLLLVKENEVVVGIEAKVDEPFDETVCEIIKDSKTSKGKYERLEDLYECIYNSKINNQNLRYQLLTATVGTLKEAKKAKAKKAVLVIITFKSESADKSKIKQNKKDLDDFINTISPMYKQNEGFYEFPKFKKVEFYIKDLDI